jgi:hypothetical protein
MPVPTLADAQAIFIDTINNGPAALDPDLFAGPIDRVFLGLKAHANTISHARLVALEETFPMTRCALGEGRFNDLCRNYCETSSARASDANIIGANFTDFLRHHIDDFQVIDLASIEWEWLSAYNAPDVGALDLAMLGALDENAMLALPISLHPAARIIHLNMALSPQLSELDDDDSTAAILITRPEAEVRMMPINAIIATVFDAAKYDTDMCNLLSIALEQLDETASLEPILTLIGAGALMTTG